MPMMRAQKEAVVAKMREDLERAAGTLFLDFTGLTVAEADAFRRKLQAAEVGYVVVKNTLMKLAVADTSYADVSGCFQGTPTGVVLGFDDPVAPAKVTDEFMKSCDHLKFKGGVVEGRPISVDEAKALAKMPSRAETQGEIVTLAMSPGRRVAGMVAGPASQIAGAIKAMADKLEDGE